MDEWTRVMSDDLRAAVEEALSLSHEILPQTIDDVIAIVREHDAPLIEARVREARAEELDFVAAEIERSANRIEKAKGATERTKFMRDMVDVLRNRAREVRR